MRVRPTGPDPGLVDSLLDRLVAHPTVRRYLNRARHRLLSFQWLEPEPGRAKPRRPPAADRYLATFYDYTHSRTIQVAGSLQNRRRVEVEETGAQPLPSAEEFEDAVRLLRRRDPELGSAIAEGRLRPYCPMPPLILEQLPDGRYDRTVAVGLLPGEGQRHHEIVGVNMVRRSVVRFPSRAPAGAAAHNPICGQPHAFQPTAAKGTAGQVWVTVSLGSTVLWRFLAVRPAASSGTNGSGGELRFVDYKGKRVLYRAHVPILNVKYDGDACGPYRDWQFQEGMIQAAGTDVAPGFRLCPSPATTILDTGSDTGSFLGTAIYVDGLEVVLVSEMEAGWYRYVSQWRLHADGTIRPRFGFSAVESSCVCHVHHHHAYWRFDFDIVTPGNNLVREFNDPCLPGFCPSNWHDKVYEIARPRDYGRSRKWRVSNTVTGDAYDLVPGPNDGVAASSPDWPFPRGDVWILHYRGTEIDDGVTATGPPYEAGIGGWVNGEYIVNQDVVIWYGAHFKHDVAAEPPGTFGDIVGPDLRSASW